MKETHLTTQKSSIKKENTQPRLRLKSTRLFEWKVLSGKSWKEGNKADEITDPWLDKSIEEMFQTLAIFTYRT